MTTKQERRVAILQAALQTIADTPCDHGPGFCARTEARVALARVEGIPCSMEDGQ